MKRPPLLKSSFVIAFIALYAGLVQIACMLDQNPPAKVASTSVTTGNPVGMTFVLTKDSIPISITGRIEVYAATQIPVPGFSPSPLYSAPISNAKEIRLDAVELKSVPDSLWAKTSIEADSIYRFNVVLTGDSIISVLKEFRLNKSRGYFIPREVDQANAVISNRLKIHAPAVSLIPYRGVISNERISMVWDYYMFIYGTGFFTKGIGESQEDGVTVFTFEKVPKGVNDCFLILLPGPNHPASGIDSTSIFSLAKPFNTEIDTLILGPEQQIIELPDSLKTK
jgi:hypothetical protein